MTYHYAILSIALGIGSYLVTAGVAYLGSRARQWARYHDSHERVVDLAHRLVQAQAEVMHAEAALAREVEEQPAVERARFVGWARDMAGALPPLLVAQLRRFGLADEMDRVAEYGQQHVPPPEIVGMVVAPGEDIRAGLMVAEVDGMAVATTKAEEQDAWRET